MSCRCYFSALNSICSVYMIRAAKKGNLQGRWVGEGKKYFSGKGSLPTPFDLFPNQDCLQLPKHLNSMGGHGFNGSTGGCHGYFPCPCIPAAKSLGSYAVLWETRDPKQALCRLHCLVILLLVGWARPLQLKLHISIHHLQMGTYSSAFKACQKVEREVAPLLSHDSLTKTEITQHGVLGLECVLLLGRK